jgi:hypothetical protein
MGRPLEEIEKMRSFYKCATVPVGILVALGAWGCGSEKFEAMSSGEAGAAGAAGAMGAAGSPGDDAGTPKTDSGKPTKPEPAPECVAKPGADEPDDAFLDTNCDGIDGDATGAVFVSPNGDDTASGASDAPVKSIAKAIEVATSTSKDVYVCNATYSENLSLAKSVRVFGGYDCATWTRSSAHATVAPSSGIPLRLAKVTDASFDGIDFVAPDAIDASGSSIAVVVDQSTGIAFRRSLLESGAGANGTPGANGVALTVAAHNGADGQSVTIASCSAYSEPWPGTVCASAAPGGNYATDPGCKGAWVGVLGGKGGSGGNQHEALAATAGGTPVGGGAAGTPSASGGSVGQAGTVGAAGTNGVSGGDIGTIVNGNYVASNAGTNGTDGVHGRGGGGGAGGWSALICQDICSAYSLGSGGGQGGYGGCGGNAGKGGAAGGASIAILVIDSSVELSESTLRTAQGGKGGAAGAGSAGQLGGAGGKGGANAASKVAAKGTAGGNGGKGGNGGAGGPGGGGASVAIVVKGTTQPTTTSVTFELGTPGAGGLAASGAPGETGASTSMLTL